MATAPVIITGTNGDTPFVGTLFEGLKFFLLRRIPQRSRWQEGIEANGGSVVTLEERADYVIADHARTDAPGGSYSWTFIDTALKTGQLPDPGEHATHKPQDVVRDVGLARPPKGARTPFTREDDLLLWNWVQREKAEGQKEFGNEIYKRIETAHPRHTFHSWRDRYVKKLMANPPASAQTIVSANPPPSPPTEVVAEQPVKSTSKQKKKESPKQKRNSASDHPREQPAPQGPTAADFSTKDFDVLMQQADDIEDIDGEQHDQAWAVWTEGNGHHTASEWCWYWETVVRPAYLAQRYRGSNTEPTSVDDGIPSQAELKQKQSYSLDDFEKEIAGSVKRKREAPSSARHSPNKRRAVVVEEEADRAPGTIEQRSDACSPQPESAPYQEISEDPNAVNDETVPTRGTEEDVPLQLQSESMLTSDINQQADEQIQNEVGKDSSQPLESRLPQEETFVTSDLNHEADRQIRRDAMDENGDFDDLTDRPMTSDANRAADEQLRHESASADGASRREGSAAVNPHSDLPKPASDSPMTTPQRFEHLHTVQSASKAKSPVPIPALLSPSKQLRSPLQIFQPVSTPPASPFANPPWTVAEDEIVLQGLRLGLNATRIAKQLESLIERSASAVRARKAHLKMLHDERFPSSQETPDFNSNGLHYNANEKFETVKGDEPLIASEAEVEMGAGHLLTEANLASQQAQHNHKSHRATDLPEDDESEDQMAMANYLQDILGVTKSSGVIDLSNEDAGDLEENDFNNLPSQLAGFHTQSLPTEEHESVAYPQLPQNFADDMSLSSQQEIDDAIEGAFNWPASRGQRKCEGARPETASHISYHTLLLSLMEDQPGTSLPFSSQSETSQLLSQLQQGDTAYEQRRADANEQYVGSHDGEDNDLELAPPATGERNEDQDIDTEEDQDDSSEEGSTLGNELDLMIASPPGGFQSLKFTSSPEKPAQEIRKQREEEQAAFPSLTKNRPTEVVDISSHASSSSYHSSKPKEPLLQGTAAQKLKPQAPAPTAFMGHLDEVQDSDAEGDEDDSESQTSSQSVFRKHTLETQDILNSETQVPEFEMPLPPESDSDEEETPPARPFQSHLTPDPNFVDEEEEEEEDLDTFITLMGIRSYDENSVIRALQRTSGHQGLAKLVLIEQKLGRGLPRDIPGIWDEKEDELLMSTDAAVLRELDEVHGEEECIGRRRFLEAQI